MEIWKKDFNFSFSMFLLADTGKRKKNVLVVLVLISVVPIHCFVLFENWFYCWRS